MLRPFDYVRARTTGEAVALLAEHGASARALAGGTDLLVDLKQAPGDTRLLVDVAAIPELRGIELTERGLRIGSATTHAEIVESDLIAQHAPALARAAGGIGAVQTRNLGTIGGNIASCVSCMDSGPSLMVLDAVVSLEGPGGRRSLPVDAFFFGHRRAALEAGELLVEILIPAECLGKPASFRKFGLRKGQALALVNAAASLRLDGATGVVADPRLALGAVAPTPMRAREAEAFLSGRRADGDTLAQAARLAAAEARPIDDFRASAQYRRRLIAVLARRVLEDALAESAASH